MEHLIEIRQKFDEAFKKKVIEEYLAGGVSKSAILRKYNIRFKGALHAWMSKLGYNDQKKQSRNFSRLNPESLPKSKPADSLSAQSKEELIKKIALLEEQLQDEKLRAEMYSRVIEIAEKELKVPIRKKFDTK